MIIRPYMYYYLICFAFSSFLFWFGERLRLEKIVEPIRWFIYGIALLIPSVLAGLRDVTVGTDMLVYGVPVFKSAYYAKDFGELFNEWSRMEIGYLGLNYVIARISSTHYLFFFLIMFTEVFFVYLAIRRWKHNVPLWLGMLIFYLLFYNDSLNAMRQYLALSIGFFGLQYIFERKFFRFIFWIFLASLFHVSGWILILYYPLWWWVNRFSSLKSVILFCGLLLFAVVYLQYILADYLFLLGGKMEQASWYIGASHEGKEFPYNTLAFYGLVIVLSLFNRKRILSSFSIGNLLYYVMAILFVLPIFEFYAGRYAVRLFVFITIWLVIFIPVILYSFRIEPRPIINIAIISYCCFYWYMIYMVGGAGETQNYMIGI